jgi:hypothetical protein
MQQLEQQQKEEDRLTNIIKEYGPQELGYACLWRAEDIGIVTDYIAREAQLLEVEDQTMHLEFINQIERALNDHKGAGLTFRNKKAEILGAAKVKDLPTIQGLSYTARGVIQLLNKWKYMGAGNDPREARAYQQQLFGELGTRADMEIVAQGSITRVTAPADALKFIGIFPASFPTITVREAAVFNTLSGTSGTMLERISFPDLAIAHTVSGTAFTVSILVNFLMVTRWG